MPAHALPEAAPHAQAEQTVGLARGDALQRRENLSPTEAGLRRRTIQANDSAHSLQLLSLAGRMNPASRVPTSGVNQRVVQRQLDGEYKAGTQIKIFISANDEDDPLAGDILLVYLAEDWTEEQPMVRYREERETSTPSKAGKKNGQGKKPAASSIDARFAFPATDKDNSVRLHAKEIVESDLAAKSLTIPDTVLAFLLEEAQQAYERDDYECEVEPTPEKMVLIAKDWEYLQLLTAGDDFDLEGFKTTFTEEGMLEELMDLLNRQDVDREVQSRSVVSQGGASSGSSEKEWKSKQTERLKGELLEALSGSPLLAMLSGGSTLHHKLSRSKLKNMLVRLNSATSSPGTQAMYAFIQKVQKLTSRQDPEEALENWTANIELGVLADNRDKDPGAAFDGNFPDGTATPRTEKLQEVDLELDKDSLDWAKIAGLLEQVLAEHAHMTANQPQPKLKKPEHFTLPHLEQWTNLGNGKYSREKQKTE